MSGPFCRRREKMKGESKKKSSEDEEGEEGDEEGGSFPPPQHCYCVVAPLFPSYFQSADLAILLFFLDPLLLLFQLQGKQVGFFRSLPLPPLPGSPNGLFPLSTIAFYSSHVFQTRNAHSNACFFFFFFPSSIFAISSFYYALSLSSLSLHAKQIW